MTTDTVHHLTHTLRTQELLERSRSHPLGRRTAVVRRRRGRWRLGRQQ